MHSRYRITSLAALAATALLCLSGLLPGPRRPVSFDPCMLWVQVPFLVKLATALLFYAFLVFLLQGIRNRPGPRWLAVVGLCSLLVLAHDRLWWWQSCSTPSHIAIDCLWGAAMSTMLLHHALQPRRAS